LSSNDADTGYPLTASNQRYRGHGVTVAANLVAATPPPAELAAHHRTFGLGPTRVVCPHVASAAATLAELVLADAGLLAHLRADRSLTRMLTSYKSPSAARLIDTLGLTPVYCDPTPEAYAQANDKLALARAGPRHGFATLPAETITDEAALAAGFSSLSAHYGAGCILRLRRGASGRHIHHVRSVRVARRVWRRLAAGGGEALLLPYVPPAEVRRNVATHGIVTAEGFAPLLFTDQIIRRHAFRGGRVTAPWSPEETAALHAGLAGVARWFHEVGYSGAPAGVDGFLVDGKDGPRFVVLDPNARLSATMGPWAAAAVLMEHAGRPLVWRFEGFRMLGRSLTLERLRRRLGRDLLAPNAIEQGGVLPTLLTECRFGPGGTYALWMILLGRDADHVEHLRRRVRSLALIAR
jgi:hypothetical protein